MADLRNPLGVVRALAYIAWSDARLNDDERAYFDRFLTDLGVPEAARAEGAKMLLAGPSLDDVVRGLHDDDDRRGAIEHALKLAHADGRYSAVEAERVERLAEALGISPETLAELEAALGDQLIGPSVPPSEGDGPRSSPGSSRRS